MVDPEKTLVTITENGYGKRTPFDDFRLMKNRGGYGVVCQNCTGKTGRLCGIVAASESDDLMMITDQGVVIRTPASGLSLLSRTASGVIAMRLEDGQKVANITRIDREDEEKKSGTAAVPSAVTEAEDVPDTEPADAEEDTEDHE